MSGWLELEVQAGAHGPAVRYHPEMTHRPDGAFGSNEKEISRRSEQQAERAVQMSKSSRD